MTLVRKASVAAAAWVVVSAWAGWADAETNWNLQAVNASGTSAWTGAYPYTVIGVILNNPEDMLDATFDSSDNPVDLGEGAMDNGAMGAEWQIFIQGIGADRGGTALWMGQNYRSLGGWVPAHNYYDAAGWTSEMNRLNYDADHQFRQGDLVSVTVNTGAFYGGKQNINESHSISSANNFSISLITADYGMPAVEVLTLSDLYVSPGITGYNASYPMFDQTRDTGAEHYQGMYVRLNGLTLTDAGGWGQSAWGDRLCTVTDGLGREFTLRMPLSDLGEMPTGVFDAYGIINQESGSGSDGRYGYELFVTNIVPEPTSLALLAAGTLVILRRCKK